VADPLPLDYEPATQRGRFLPADELAIAGLLILASFCAFIGTLCLVGSVLEFIRTARSGGTSFDRASHGVAVVGPAGAVLWWLAYRQVRRAKRRADAVRAMRRNERPGR
jgi:hypothetical protein